MTLSAAIGFIMVLTLVFCLIWKKLLPPVAFIILPIIAALAAGFGLTEIGDFASDGIAKMVSTVSLFVFSISFFSLMSDVGVFDAVVNALTKKAGTNVTAIMLATAAIAVIGHLDGSGATTFIITASAMYPIFKKMKLDKRALMLITCLAIGVMNIMPWGGPTLRAATVLGIEATDLWHPLIPVQLIMLAITFIVAFLLSKVTKKGAAGTADDSADRSANQAPTAVESAKDDSPKWKLYFNYILTVGVVAVLVSGKLPSAFVFMIALALGLTVNIPNLKQQSGKLKEYGVAAMSMVVTLFAAGVFTGILGGTGMLDSMAEAIVSIIPAALGPYAHIIIAVLAVPLIMCLGTDAFYFGLLPVVISICSKFGVAPEAVARVLIVAENVGVMISPMTPAVFLGLGMLDLDIGDHIRFSLPWIWGCSITAIILSVVLGIVPV
ncbi:MAG: citrate:proton symporter [Lachnospiraceae bacterium]|nr:citrate:proton symporter [Lachnospiraceae bacterium]